jgi:hypothetical protein
MTAPTETKCLQSMEIFMESIILSLTAFVFIFGGALMGMLLRAKLPEHHLSAESKSVVTLGMGWSGRWPR